MAIQFQLSLMPDQRAKFDGAMARLGGGDLVERAMRQVGVEHLGYLYRRFEAASRGDGTWAPLARPETRADRVAAAIGSRGSTRPGATGPRPPATGDDGDRWILRKTDALIRSLIPGAPGNVLVVAGSSVRIGTSVWYGKFHQFGTVRMPARKVVVRPDRDTRAKAHRILAAAVRAAFDRSTAGGP